jgi:hypothetical protein
MYGHGKIGHCRLSFVQQLQKIRFLYWPMFGFKNDGGLLMGPCLGVVRCIYKPLASIGRGSSHVRTIHKPLAYITNLLAKKSGINFVDYYKDI